MKIKYLFYIFLMFSLGMLEAKEEFDSKMEISSKSSDLSFEDKKKPLAEKVKSSVGDNNSPQSDSRVISKKSAQEPLAEKVKSSAGGNNSLQSDSRAISKKSAQEPLAEKVKSSAGGNNSPQSDSRVISKKSAQEPLAEKVKSSAGGNNSLQSDSRAISKKSAQEPLAEKVKSSAGGNNSLQSDSRAISKKSAQEPLAEKVKSSAGGNNSPQSDSRAISKKSAPEPQKSSLIQKNLIPEESFEVNVKDKIEETFKKFLKILEPHPIESKEYKKAASFLEKTLYDEVSFDSLKLLSELYLKKEDIKGHLRVVKAISVSYPSKAESFYLLGKAHKAFSEILEDEDELEANQKKIFENYRKALKLDPKHAPAYQVFLKELMILDEESQELKHSKESLSTVMDMLKYLKEKQHYILLCEAYYDTNFIRQTQKACVKSIKKNRNDPISLMTLAFSLSNKKKRDEKLLEIGGKYPNSFKTQYKIGLYFRKENSPEQAVTHFIRASQIQPDHLRLHEILSRLLLRNNREEEAYSYFLKTCLLSDGVFLSEFRNALGILRRKKKVEAAIKFDKGVKECFQKIKDKKQNKKERKQNKN